MITVNEGTLYEGWAGSRSRTWHTDAELKSLLLADLKKAGIKATVRFPRAGYLTAVTVTITIKSDEIITFDEFRKKTGILSCVKFGNWVDYRNESGKRETIHIDRLLYATDLCEQARITKSAIETRYADMVEHIKDFHDVSEDILVPEAVQRIHTAKSIVTSYNRDCSNSQIDYFDRDIYDSYKLKVV